MTDSVRTPFDWRGVVLDAIIIVSITVLTALQLANLYLFLALVGPLVGARLAAVRASTAAAVGGSTLLLLVLGLWQIVRRAGGGS
jgi:hypothetical protein